MLQYDIKRMAEKQFVKLDPAMVDILAEKLTAQYVKAAEKLRALGVSDFTNENGSIRAIKAINDMRMMPS